MRRLAPLLITLALLSSYVYVLPRWADWNQNSRLNLVRALSERQVLEIDAYVANTGDYAYVNGHYYSDKPPGTAMLALPAALAIQPVLALPAVSALLERAAGSGALGATLNPEGSGLRSDKLTSFVLQVLVTFWVVALPSALSGGLLYVLLRRRGLAGAPAGLVALGYGWGTPVAAYAGNFYSHALVAALLLGCWALATAPYHPRRALLLGLLIGWATISEFPAAIPAMLIGGLAAWQWRRIPAPVWIALGGLGPALVLGIHNAAAFGSPFTLGYSHSTLWQDQHTTGFMSITLPQPAALWGLTFSPYRGLFIRAPWLLLALAGLTLWWRSRAERAGWWALALAATSILLVYAGSVMWWGGFSAGPRYITPMVPLLALAAAPAAAWLWRRAAGRAALVTLVAVSVVLTWSELLARQLLPADSFRNPWRDYVLPAWMEGDIARNLGTVAGLAGAWSVLPLVVLAGMALILCLRLDRPGATPGAAREAGPRLVAPPVGGD